MLLPTLVKCFCNNLNESGNPAAVIINHLGGDHEKQTIATKLDLPVTVFVSQTQRETPLIEFYYPNRKMSLCLHGTLAAASILMSESNALNITFKTNENMILKTCRSDSGEVEVEVSSQPLNQSRVALDTISKMLNVDISSISNNMPLAVSSVGSPKLLIPMVSKRGVANLMPNFTLIEKWSLENNVNGLYVYTQDTETSTFLARGFNPKTGHREDAATGVAAAALSLLLKSNIEVNQGLSLNQPCTIKVCYYNENSIWVGGKVKNMQNFS